jgi:agmatine/peptidylarginine deiminase
LLEIKDRDNFTDSLQVFITPSQIVIAAAQNEKEEKKEKGSI